MRQPTSSAGAEALPHPRGQPHLPCRLWWSPVEPLPYPPRPLAPDKHYPLRNGLGCGGPARPFRTDPYSSSTHVNAWPCPELPECCGDSRPTAICCTRSRSDPCCAPCRACLRLPDRTYRFPLCEPGAEKSER